MLLHLFNPGYEPSAKQLLRHFTPTRSVRQLRHDLATLPLYYAAEEEGVLVPEDLPGELRTDRCRTKVGEGDRLLPWGWAPEVPGAPYSAEAMHRWASRARSVALWETLYDPDLFGEMMSPRLITCEEEFPPEGDPWVAKLDFSSSGRGIFFLPRPGQTLREGLGRLLSQQGSFFLEPHLDRVSDRGYEFVRREDGRIDYLGVNLFETTGEGRYGASLVAPRPVIEALAERQVTRPSHRDYLAHLAGRLKQFDFCGYTGPFGIDTVVRRDGDGSLRLAPSVEINLRRTMGQVALELAKRLDRLGATRPHLLEIVQTPEGLTGLPLYLTRHLSDDAPTLLTPLLPGTRFVALLRPLPTT